MNPEAHGDAELANQIVALTRSRHPVIAAAVVTRGEPVVAVRGAPLGADFEIGSVSKGITGLLYRDAVGRGEVTPARTLGELLPVGDAAIGRVTLGSLSIHRSGLPSLPRAAQPVRGTVRLWRHGTNPYGEDLEQLLAQARGVKVGKPRRRYSNLGFQLLGHAVASGAGTVYRDLVRDRLAQPLGLTGLYVPASSGDLRPNALTGRSRSGRVQEAWTGEGLGPAGGVRATISDMGRLLTALLDGSAPGIDALDPVESFAGAARIGAGWLTLEVKGRSVTWHNGGTGGFRSWVGMDRAAGTGVALLSARSTSLDRPGFTLLAERAGAA